MKKFTLFLMLLVAAVTTAMAQSFSEANLKTLTVPGNYYVYHTDANGVKHYLQIAGANSVTTVTENPEAFEVAEGIREDQHAGDPLFSKSYLMKMKGTYISNTDQNATNIKTDTEAKKWTSQVAFVGDNGKCAIRLTNSSVQDGWHGHYFIDLNENYQPIGADPSLAEALYLWEFEEVVAPPFEVGVEYRIQCATEPDYYLQFVDYNKILGDGGNSEGAMQFKPFSNDESQIFVLEIADEAASKYYIKNVKNGTTYYFHSNQWNCFAQTENKTAVKIELTNKEQGIYTMHQTEGDANMHGYIGNSGLVNNSQVSMSNGLYVYSNQGLKQTNSTTDSKFITWKFVEVGSEQEMTAEEKEAKKAEVDEMPVGVGYLTSAAREALKTAIDGVTYASEIPAIEATIKTDIANIEMPVAGKYYALDSYMSFLSDPADAAANLKTNVTSKYTKSALWLFEEQDNGAYHIKNALTGKYIGNSAKMSDTAKEFVLVTTNTEETNSVIETKTVEFGKLYIKENIATSSLCLHSIEENAKMHQGGGLGNQYSFIEVPALSVGDAGWATLFLGVNTTIPADVDVYAVTGVKDGNWLNMTEVTGVLPANEGVLVNAAAGLYVFEETSTEATIDGNLLVGTTIQETANATDVIYVLAKVNDNVGLYKANTESGDFTIKANRAYLPASALTAEQQNSVGFRFDFATTAVEKVEMRNEKEEIYDLQGRRINKITEPGIYIVNGVKVLVK